MASTRALMRTPAFLRAAVLVAIGLVVTFTAPEHSVLAFNRLVFGVAVLTLGLVQVIVFVNPKLRPYLTQGGLALIFLDLVAAAFALIAATSIDLLTHVIAIWAVGSAVIAVLSRSRHSAARIADAWVQAGLLVLLAIAVELSRGDQVMLIGFFGAYALLGGVFQAIAAFDLGRGYDDSGEPASPTPAPGVDQPAPTQQTPLDPAQPPAAPAAHADVDAATDRSTRSEDGGGR